MLPMVNNGVPKVNSLETRFLAIPRAARWSRNSSTWASQRKGILFSLIRSLCHQALCLDTFFSRNFDHEKLGLRPEPKLRKPRRLFLHEKNLVHNDTSCGPKRHTIKYRERKYLEPMTKRGNKSDYRISISSTYLRSYGPQGMKHQGHGSCLAGLYWPHC
jgi:hypothetical protein